MWFGNRKVPPEVRVNLVLYMPDGCSELTKDAVDAQLTKQGRAMASAGWVTELNQILSNLPTAPCLVIHMDSVEELHEIQLPLLYGLGRTINRRTVNR